ncbi:MAG: (d)CMP kinase [Rectinema sp.]
MAGRIIAVSGKSGCGNSTVSRIVAETLGLRLINYTFRALAEEKGLSLAEVLDRAQNDPSWDRLLDHRQVELASEGDCVIGSRLAMWLVPEADLRIYLKAGPEARARRIHAREGGDLAEIAHFTAGRDTRDRGRYMEIYGIDTDDLSRAHLVVDTERWDASGVAATIVEAYRRLPSRAAKG